MWNDVSTGECEEDVQNKEQIEKEIDILTSAECLQEMTEILMEEILKDMGLGKKEYKQKIPKQKVKVQVSYEKEIEKCYHECPYFDLEGMEHCMVCKHPSLKGIPYGEFIISHPSCDNGFPDACPLFKEQTNV